MHIGVYMRGGWGGAGQGDTVPLPPQKFFANAIIRAKFRQNSGKFMQNLGRIWAKIQAGPFFFFGGGGGGGGLVKIFCREC